MTAGIAVQQEISLRKRLPLRHFRQLQGPDIRHLFHRQPEPFGDHADRELLAYALGATLYAPATRADLAETIRRRAAHGVCSMVIDLEDAVADHEVEMAKLQAVETLDLLATSHDPNPLLFIRVRDADTIGEIVERLSRARPRSQVSSSPNSTAPPGRSIWTRSIMRRPGWGGRCTGCRCWNRRRWCIAKPVTRS